MKKRWPALFIASMLLSLILAIGQDDTTSNLLENGDFEGDFVELTGAAPRNVAKSWTPWHIPPSDTSPSFANHDPHYDKETDRIHLDESGNAQKYFTLFATHKGGVYQQVDDLTTGMTYRFSIYAYVWSSSFEDADVSEDPGAVVVRVGIDPKGGTDGASGDIIWSTSATFLYDAYRQYAVIATAETTTITVFVESTVGEPRANNYIYLDDAVLEFASETTVEATPTSETNTGLATATPVETATETSSPTPVHTHTPTPEPTATREPTLEQSGGASGTGGATDPSPTAEDIARPSPTPTSTLQSSESNQATATASPAPTEAPSPSPTASPLPTDTPSPSPTATASPTGVSETPAVDQTPETVTHVVVSGDTVSALALEYGSTISAINIANGLNEANLIYIGQRLIIPINQPEPLAEATSTPALTPSPTPTIAPTATPTPSPTATPVTYQILSGDTLETIAARFGTTVDLLAARNGIANPHQIDVGQILVIPTPAPTATPWPTITPWPTATFMPTATPADGAATTSTTIYVVQAGDLLSSIAAEYNTTVAAIAQLNGITNPSRIFPGQQLQIPTGSGQASQAQLTPTSAPTPTPQPTSVPVTYSVQSGDTLFSIAAFYGVSVVELAQLNHIFNYDQLSIGQVLTIPG